jgi:4-hydroxy-tetrahydrodipicolinate synthase
MEFSGAFTALVTPFKNDAIDEEKYREHMEWQIEQGINGLVPCGTTGESATMSHEEHMQAIRICVDQVKGRVPVLAGSGSNSTREAIELTRFAKEAGAEGALLITPYYNKPTQPGLLAHYQAVSQAVPFPLIVYNVPGRTGVNLLPQTLAAMKKEVSSVVGVKEASGSIAQVSEIIELCGRDFSVLSGEDFITHSLLGLGGKGVISVVSNIVPGKMAALCRAHFENQREEAIALHYELAPLCRAMFFETNPIPVKTSLSLMGRMDLELRLPLVPMEAGNETRLKDVLQQSGLL